MDWDAGSYKRAAVELEPASAVVLAALRANPGATLLDVACGNGNLSLAAVRAGLKVTGSDLAPGLVEEAKERFAADGLEADWQVADAQDLPFADDSFDNAASVFGAIFPPDGRRTAAELKRVVRPGGVVALSAWVPAGGIAEWIGLARGVAAEYAPPPADAPPPTAWHPPDVLRDLLGPDVEITEHTVPLVSGSPAAWVAEQREFHPAWLSMQEVIPKERFDALEVTAVEMLSAANEDPAGFRVSSPYVVARAEVS
jgi:SAM-dependent methyltransferase